MTPTVIIVLIIIISGLLGGITNYLLLWNAEISAAERRIIFFKSIFMGLCASLTVPLFLQVLPNSLLDLDAMKTKNYFIFAGLCVLAAFFSKRFLEDLYSRLNRLEKKTEETKKAIETVELQNQEMDNIDEITEKIITLYKPAYKKKEVRDVTDAVLNSTYSYRTIHGISEDTCKDDKKVKDILDLLEKSGYIESKKNNRGTEIWKSIYHQKESLT